jgi:ATP-dependent protease HslVU (ClpYQ) peptidase subunit
MTCIVAVTQNGTVYMASDHAASDDKSGLIFARKEPKVFKVGQYGIAFTDSFRMGQILQYNWSPPKYTPTKTNSGLDKFIRTKFIDSVKVAFKDNGYGSFGSSAESEDVGGVFIVGVEGRIYTVDEDFHVGEHVLNYMAEGSGCMFALGALHATKHQKNPKMRLKSALEAASEFSMSVAPPFTYIQV